MSAFGRFPYNAVGRQGWQREKGEADMASKQSTELASRASAIYEQKLRSRLESTNPDDFVAIEPESGDFFLGKTLSEAIQAARTAHPARLPFALRVGHTSTVEIGVTTP
jgi:hypothetical protein